jgi:putative transposase
MGHARRRHTPEQIIRKLREADRLLGEGQEVVAVAKQLEVSEQTLHRWRVQYGGLKADDAKRLKELERENARLKRMVADQLLEIDAWPFLVPRPRWWQVRGSSVGSPRTRMRGCGRRVGAWKPTRKERLPCPSLSRERA